MHTSYIVISRVEYFNSILAKYGPISNKIHFKLGGEASQPSSHFKLAGKSSLPTSLFKLAGLPAKQWESQLLRQPDRQMERQLNNQIDSQIYSQQMYRQVATSSP